jgi:5'-nucleotidase
MIRALFSRLSLLLLLVAASAAAAQAPGARVVTFLHFNDVYEITPMNSGRSGGLARVATVRDSLRRLTTGLITDLAGDFLSPSALGLAVVDGKRLAGKQMVATLNAVGLDVATFGNHEFDVRPEELLARLGEMRFRMVSTNVSDSSGALFPGTSRHLILRVPTRGGTARIGMIGLTIAENVPKWARIDDPIPAARHEIDLIRDSVDAIVALTHLSIATDQRLVEAIPDLALVLGGHEHENWLVRRGERFTPIVKADANVRTLAVVTLALPPRHRPPVVTSRLIVVDSTIRLSPRVSREVAHWTTLADSAWRAQGLDPKAVVTRLTEPLDGREAIVRTRQTRLGEVIADALKGEVPGAEVGIVNGGSIRFDDVLAPGPITVYDLIRVLPFGGKVVGTTMTGALLQKVVEQGEANIGSGGYLQLSGIRREGDRWTVNGAPLDPERHYVVGASDFLLTGRETGLSWLAPGNPGLGPIREYRDIRQALTDRLRQAYGGPS